VSPKIEELLLYVTVFFFQVIFEAQKGLGYLGDIAIDQITFTRERCILVPSSASPNMSANSGVGKRKKLQKKLNVLMLCSSLNSMLNFQRNFKI